MTRIFNFAVFFLLGAIFYVQSDGVWRKYRFDTHYGR